jgi:hypothetical protein
MAANQPTNQPDRVLKHASKQARGRIQRTFDIPIDKSDYAELIDKEADLLKLEARAGWSKADLCRAAWAEYVTRHHPGNNALSLHPWIDGEPFSQAAREKLGLTNTFNVKCAFCGNYFDTTEDMITPTCPKCRKPGAPK